ALMGITSLVPLLPAGLSPADVFVPPALLAGLLQWKKLGSGLAAFRLESIFLALFLLQVLLSTVVHQAGWSRFLGAAELAAVFLLLAACLHGNERGAATLERVWIFSAAALSAVALTGSALSAAGIAPYF